MERGGIENEARLTRREREQARHRDEALAAAERLLAELPYSAISVQRIAEEAEFSVGYLYKLFPSKDELYLSLVEERKAELLDGVREVVEGSSEFGDGLTRVLDAVEEWVGRHPGFARDNRAELMLLFHRDRDRAEAILEKDRLMTPLLVELFRRGVREGVVGGESPERMARTFRALVWGFMADDLHLMQETRPEYRETIMQILLRTYSRVWTEND